MNDNHSQSPSNTSQKPQNYRPRSPDLSGLSAPPPPSLSRLPSVPYQQDFPPGYSFSPRSSYDASPYFSPQTSQAPPYFGSPYQQPGLPVGVPQQYYSEPQTFSAPQYQDDMARLRTRPQVNYNDNAHPHNEFDERVLTQQPMPPQPQPIMAAREPMPVQQPFQHQQPLASIPPQTQQSHLSSIPRVNVATKFPVARIKRIMQADEDVGKVAQATPTAVAKALECFMVALVAKGAITAKAEDCKRVTATHLKNALLADPQYDFLNEICENVPDESAKRPRAKGEPKSEDSDDEDIGGPKKKKGAGKKRKAGGNDSD